MARTANENRQITGDVAFDEGGMGLPHSRTSRKERHAICRDSPALAGECRCPLPLSFRVSVIGGIKHST